MSSVPLFEDNFFWSARRLRGTTFNTWYTIAGKLKGRTHRPLVVIHGGPGSSHDYLLPIAELASLHSIPVVFYDQIGTARSTHFPEKKGDGTFWTEQLFLDELDVLLAHLGIGDDYDLLGHSWGGMLATRHATRNPAGLKNLVISNCPASMPLWVACLDRLRASLPKDVQSTLAKHEADGTMDDPAYKAAVQVFYEKYICRVKPTPEPLAKTNCWFDQERAAFSTMFGPSELVMNGTLKEWTVVDDIHKITARTLLINGRFDTVQDSALQPIFDRLAKVKWVQFAESSHLPHLEETERYIKVVGDFLKLA